MVKKKSKYKGTDINELKQFELVEIREERTVSRLLSRRIISTTVAEQDELRKKRAEAITKYAERYKIEYTAYLEHGYVLEPKVVNNCRKIMIDAKVIKSIAVDREDIIILKSIIRTVANNPMRLIYIYANVQSALRSLASELRMNSTEYDYILEVDLAYSEVFDEMILGQKGGIIYG